jgi:hypothetical protein
MLLGAAFTADTLEDLDIVHRMAQKMGCHPLFELSEWADVRISRGDRGNFLFINNYQDDPIATTIIYEGEMLFGGNPIHLPARRGFILPLEWQPGDGVRVHYATGEITGMRADDSSITLTVVPSDFVADLTLVGYYCDEATIVHDSNGQRRVQLQGKEGRITLLKDR